jgi:hypothetical protein
MSLLVAAEAQCCHGRQWWFLVSAFRVMNLEKENNVISTE